MKYPFYNEFTMKCPKCGGHVIFNIKAKPNFRTEEGWSGYFGFCKKRFSFMERHSVL
jgi:rRNA maturation protein Nop10